MVSPASPRHVVLSDVALSDVVPASSMAVWAHERLLPVHPALIPLFIGPDGVQTSSIGLVRGQTVVCTGSAAVSCALAVAAEVTRSGSWAAIVGLPTIGVQAAAAIGVSLERTVFVKQPDQSASTDASRAAARGDIGSALSALIDGVDLVVVSRRFMASLSPSLVRRLQSRAQSKGSTLVVIGDPVSVSVDVRFTARTVSWEGVGEGHGHLRRRLVAIEMDGRRCPRSRTHTVWLPDADGAATPVDRLAGVADMNAPRAEMSSDSDAVHGGIVLPLHRSGRDRYEHGDRHDETDR